MFAKNLRAYYFVARPSGRAKLSTTFDPPGFKGHALISCVGGRCYVRVLHNAGVRTRKDLRNLKVHSVKGRDLDNVWGGGSRDDRLGHPTGLKVMREQSGF